MSLSENRFGNRNPTAEELAAFEADMAAATAKFTAAAVAEAGMPIGAGWRPWMGPRPEPTPEEVAAHAAATEAADAKLMAHILDGPPFSTLTRVIVGDPAALTDAQRRAADARPGEPVHLTDPATARRFVLLPAEVYDRLVRAAG